MRYLLVLACLAVGLHSFAQNLTSYYDSGKKKYGYKDATGKVVIPATYEYAGMFYEGLAMVEEPADKYGYIDVTGKMVIPAMYSKASSFSAGMAAVSDGKVYFYIDKTGKKKLPQTYTHARAFSNGYAAVMNADSLGGYINTAGMMVIPYQYKEYGDFGEGLAFVRRGDKWAAINAKNEVKFEKEAIRIWKYENGFAAIQLKDRGIYNYGAEWSFLNKKGGLLSSDRFEMIAPFKGKTAIVQQYDESDRQLYYGAVDTSGKIVLPFVYTTLSRAGNHFLYSKEKDFMKQWEGLINSSFMEVTRDNYKVSQNIGDSLFVVTVKPTSKYLNSKVTLLNTTGKELVPQEYNYEYIRHTKTPLVIFFSELGGRISGSIYSMKKGLIRKNAMAPDRKYELFIDTDDNADVPIMDYEGKPLLDKSFKVMYHGSYRNAGADADRFERVKRKSAPGKDSTWFFDKKSRKLVALKYFVLEDDDFSDGMLKVTNDFNADEYSTDGKTKYGFIDSNFRLVVPMVHVEAKNFMEGRSRIRKEDPFGWGVYGYIDKTGKEVVKPMYKEATDFENGYAIVQGSKIADPVLVIDRAGKVKTTIADAAFTSIARVDKDGLLFLEGPSGKWGLWNLQGQNLIPAEYSIPEGDYILRFKDGKVNLVKDGKKYTFDQTGKML